MAFCRLLHRFIVVEVKVNIFAFRHLDISTRPAAEYEK